MSPTNGRWHLLASLCVCLGLAQLVLVGCPKQGPSTASTETKVQDGTPALHKLLALAERPLPLQLGRAEEARYTLPIHYPVIDAALERPLALPTFAAELGKALDTAVGPRELLAAVAKLDPAGESRTLPPPLSSWNTDKKRNTELASSALPLPTEALDSPSGQARVAHLPQEGIDAIRTLLATMESIATEEWNFQGGPLRRPDRAAEEFFLDPHSGTYRFGTHPIGVQIEFLEHGASINHQAIRQASLRLLRTVEELLPTLHDFAAKLPENEGPLLHLRTRLGPVILGSRGPDLHAGDAFLLIDPGGDDEWANNAGGNLGVPAQLALAIDLGGDDLYRAPRPHSQGAGFLGLGMLIDAGSGRDDYLGTQHAQGAGFLGWGLLWDQGGDDAYQLAAFGQGAGAFGAGFLIDSNGEDRLLCAARCQGFGSTLGLGALLDSGGNDRRRLGVTGAAPNDPDAGGGQGAAWGTRPYPWAQNIALHGGVGLLYDRSGDDTNYARSAAQGSARFQSLGLFLDSQGDDLYIGELEAQGAASHRAIGLLLDTNGNDRYEGGQRVQGSANDRAAGILWDRGDGTDQYRLAPIATLSEAASFGGQGYARQALAFALLIDEGGDDSYEAFRHAQGKAQPTRRPGHNPSALLIDLGGTDRYTTRFPQGEATPAQGAVWMDGKHGLGIDTERSAPGWDQRPLEPEAGFGPAFWDGRLRPKESWPPPPPGNPTGNPDDQWLALRALLRSRITSELEASAELPDYVMELATQSPSVPVRRAAGRLLASHGKAEGLDVLIQSLSYRSEDNPLRAQSGSTAAWLGRLIGQDFGSDAQAYRRWWQERPDDEGWKSRLPAVLALDRAALASAEGRFEDVQEACEAAVAAQPQARGIKERAAELVGLWSSLLAHPESNHSLDLERAETLARLANQWDASTPLYVLYLARALYGQDRTEEAFSALDKASRVDPDHPVLQKLEREFDQVDGRSQPKTLENSLTEPAP